LEPLLVATTAGLSLGIVFGYHAGKQVVLRVAGPFARKPLAIALSVGGAIGFLIPAAIFAVFSSRNLVIQSGGGLDPDSTGMLIGITAGIGISIASGLVVAIFAGACCARIIEDFRSMRE
jgi:hypothetical protein